MASRPPTPYDTFGPSPFARDPALLTQPSPFMPMAAPSVPEPSVPISTLAGNITPPADEPKPIDKLKPKSAEHARVLTKLDKLLKYSMDEMSKNYSRWQFMERKVQAYVSDQDYEKLLQSVKDSDGLPPEPIQIVVPYTYATLHSAATYIGTVLLGQKPMFPLLGVRNTAADNARTMENVLQQNVDASGGIETIWQCVWDSLLYSFFCLRCNWAEEHGKVMKWQAGQRVFEDAMIYAGNQLASIDPYDCFPDPRVPLHKCPKQGDFIFTRMNTSETVMKDMEKSGGFKWVKEALASKSTANSRNTGEVVSSHRRMRIGQEGSTARGGLDIAGFCQPFEGTVRLIPKDWGLGDGETSELWKFTWFKGGQIIQAEPLGYLHGQHPYVFAEPTSLGYEFMSLSQAEMVSVFQDILSWLVSSRMENVRASIQNTFVADPARVEINDIRASTIGRVIRMKQAAMGLPIQEAIQQLVVQDVTGGHLTDIQVMRTLGDAVTGVNDNMRGIQTAGGRRSATEARMSMQAGAGRVQQLAVRISSQGLHPLAQQMIMNIQQFIPPEMWIETGGAEEGRTSLEVTPDMLVGTFNYQVSDGSLPFDKGAMTETWKEILFGIARDPELRQRYDIGEIFRYVAQLGGAKNIDSFKRPPQALPTIAPPGADPGATPGMTNIGTMSPVLPQALQ